MRKASIGNVLLFVLIVCVPQLNAQKREVLTSNAHGIARTDVCLVFAAPKKFLEATVYLEADVSEDGTLLLPPARCRGGISFNLVFNEQHVGDTQPEHDFLRYRTEQKKAPRGVVCNSCPRYRVTSLRAEGKLIDSLNLREKSDIVLQDTGFVYRYSFVIQRVLKVDAEERQYTF